MLWLLPSGPDFKMFCQLTTFSSRRLLATDIGPMELPAPDARRRPPCSQRCALAAAAARAALAVALLHPLGTAAYALPRADVLVSNVTMETGNASAAKGLDGSASAPLHRRMDLPMASFVDPTPQEPAQKSSRAGFASLFDGLGFTVIRIQTVCPEVDWFMPNIPPKNAEYVGTGFAVHADLGSDPNPVFVTNAHVVRNAKDVQVQLPALGQQIFEAYVPLISEDFDIAVVRLKEPYKFWGALREANGTIQALHVQPTPLSLGLDVAAVGFPLGASSLKLSRGVISGTEDVFGSTCYQSTAPISPGSSGGPLFAVGMENKLQVVGVNFASSDEADAQNVNFVVPAIHVRQVLDAFISQRTQELAMLPGPTPHSERAQKAQDGKRAQQAQDTTVFQSFGNGTLVNTETVVYPHQAFRLAPINALTIEANEALYNASGGCTSGAFLSHILPLSALHFAVPPVRDRSFLVAVNNVALDRFGMGRTEIFLGNPTPFESLMTIWANTSDPVELKVCLEGVVQVHKVSMQWQDKYRSGVRTVQEPHYEPESTRFEEFADLTVMQLTVNHVMALVDSGEHPTLGLWLLPENQVMPRLVVVHTAEGTYASRVLSPGMVVERINGERVSTLESFAKHFEPKADTWELETDQGIVYQVQFHEALAQQLLDVASGRGALTAAVQSACRQLALLGPAAHGPLGEALQRNASALGASASMTNTTPGRAQDQVPDATSFVVAVEKLASKAKATALALVHGGGGGDPGIQNSTEDAQLALEASQRERALHPAFLKMRPRISGVLGTAPE